MKNNGQHKFTPEQIGAYYDGQLTDSEQTELEQHLKQCSRCQAVLADLTVLDKAVQKAESASAPEGYFQTFGSAVANRIAQQKLAPQKEAKRFNWGWITAAAAIASLAIMLVSGDLTKPRLYRAVPEEQKTILSEMPVRPEAPAEAAKDEAPAQKSRKMETAPEMDLAEVSMEKEAPAAAPAKRAKSMSASPELTMESAPAGKQAMPAAPATMSPIKDMTASRSSKPERQDKVLSTGLASAPTKTPVSTMPLEASPSSVESVTVIEICLPNGNKNCPEPRVRSAIRINLGGI